jgi:hypothetical protein
VAAVEGLASLVEDVERIAAAAAAFARDGERVAAVLPAEPTPGRRVYVCAYEADGAGEGRSWLVLDDEAAAVTDRTIVRDAVTVAALCELAAEHAALGDLDELRA